MDENLCLLADKLGIAKSFSAVGTEQGFFKVREDVIKFFCHQYGYDAKTPEDVRLSLQKAEMHSWKKTLENIIIVPSNKLRFSLVLDKQQLNEPIKIQLFPRAIQDESFEKVQEVSFVIEQERESKLVGNKEKVKLWLKLKDKPAYGYYDMVLTCGVEKYLTILAVVPEKCYTTSDVESAKLWGYTLQLYGRVLNAKKVVSYAGSFGHTRYEQLVQLGIDKEIGETMKTMVAISVRDQNSYDIVEKLTGIKAEMHLDPVLIYGYEKEIAERKVNYPEKYMVVYSYQGRINDKREIKEIVSFAKEQKLKLISIFCRYDWCDEAIIPETPFDVLGWFKDAEYVVTDTFHGTIFSIITGRKFVTILRYTNRQKITSLLLDFDLKYRLIPFNYEQLLMSILNRDVDLMSISRILYIERQNSILYLRGRME